MASSTRALPTTYRVKRASRAFRACAHNTKINVVLEQIAKYSTTAFARAIYACSPKEVEIRCGGSLLGGDMAAFYYEQPQLARFAFAQCLVQRPFGERTRQNDDREEFAFRFSVLPTFAEPRCVRCPYCYKRIFIAAVGPCRSPLALPSLSRGIDFSQATYLLCTRTPFCSR